MLKITGPSAGLSRALSASAAAAAYVLYIATIPAANLLITHVGAVGVGFGLTAPAAVFTAGLALVLRDLVHEVAGRAAVLVAIAAGTLLSYLLADPGLALASAVAFAVAELVDMAVYTPVRKHGLRKTLLLACARFSRRARRALAGESQRPARGRLVAAVAASNAVGLVVDSLLFLSLAFGSLHFLPGQVLAKAEMTLAAVVVLHLIGMRRRPA
ncbi:VUT family protein [Streptomyces pseudogriseolus]|uniref:VUT family protein n=1 Tax=Streptomyces pseudogriseolus TaxID=36817 RepID=UPI000D1BE4A7